MDAFSDFDAQFEQTLALTSGGSEYERDPNQFRPSVDDKKPEYLATVRFIPPNEGKPMFLRKIVHFMKIGNRTVRVICPKTIDDKHQCNICADNIQSHRSKIPALVEKARQNSNKLRWIANVLVLEDSVNPDNVGRVMWWEFPNQIKEYIDKLKNPPNTRIPSINAFHPAKGADFFLCMKKIDGFTKYDGSQFLVSGGPTPISEDLNYINQVRSMCHDLQSQIVIPSPEEINDILQKAGSAPVAGVQKTYGNVGFGQTPAPSVGGFGSVAQQPQQLDEFDTAFAQASAPVATAEAIQAVQAATAVRPSLAQAPAPKPALAVPGRPSLQTAESVMPDATARVTPMPTAPATTQPHAVAPVDGDEWFK